MDRSGETPAGSHVGAEIWERGGTSGGGKGTAITDNCTSEE